uniref:Uncharacterized protein n=1 Tax=Mandrillus leucophaeus TaxID=9568 RepID=A0A2K6A156_MANLE
EAKKKTRNYATMNLRDRRLKEKDRVKPKEKEKKDPSTWAHLTTSSLIPTSSTFPQKSNGLSAVNDGLSICQVYPLDN